MAAILVLWQVGIDIFEREMKKISRRQSFIETFVNDSKKNVYARAIARGTLLNMTGCMSLAEIISTFKKVTENELKDKFKIE